MARLTAAASKSQGVPANTSTPAMAMRTRPGSRSSREPPRRAASSGGEAGRLQHGRVGQLGVAQGVRDASPVGVTTVDRGLEQAAGHDRAGSGARIRVITGAA